MSTEQQFQDSNTLMPHGMIADENHETYWVPWTANLTMAGALDAVVEYDGGFDRDTLDAHVVFMRPCREDDAMPEGCLMVECQPLEEGSSRYWRIGE